MAWLAGEAVPGLTCRRPPIPCPSPHPCPDLGELSPDIARQVSPSGAGRTVAQAVVDAVVALLDSGAFSAALPSGISEAAVAGAGSPASAAAPQTAALQFLAAHLASNRAVVSGGVLLCVLQHLAAPAVVDMSAAGREAVFCDVVSSAGSGMSPADHQQVGALKGGGAVGGTCWGRAAGLCCTSHQPPTATRVPHLSRASPTPLPPKQAIFLARRAGFLQAEARVRHAEGAHAQALACLARDTR